MIYDAKTRVNNLRARREQIQTIKSVAAFDKIKAMYDADVEAAYLVIGRMEEDPKYIPGKDEMIVLTRTQTVANCFPAFCNFEDADDRVRRALNRLNGTDGAPSVDDVGYYKSFGRFDQKREVVIPLPVTLTEMDGIIGRTQIVCDDIEALATMVQSCEENMLVSKDTGEHHWRRAFAELAVCPNSAIVSAAAKLRSLLPTML